MHINDVYKAIRQHVRNHDHVMENVYVHAWEADVFSITRSTGYCYEFEVKMTRADFKIDFKKPKHHLFRACKRSHGVLPGDMSYVQYHQYSLDRETRKPIHQDLVDHKIEWQYFKHLPINGNYLPNKFQYVTPKGLVKPEEIPWYAGLWEVQEAEIGLKMVEIVKTPYMHKQVMDVRQMLFNKYYYMSIEQRNRIRGLESQLERIRKTGQLIL